MLRRALTLLTLSSLLVAVVVLFFWGRSYFHVDQFGIGNLATHRTDYASQNGAIIVTQSQNLAGEILRRTDRHPYSQAFGATLIIPAFWLAIWIRGKLPRPPGRSPRRDNYLPPLGSSRF
jgi:hypothetical protein